MDHHRHLALSIVGHRNFGWHAYVKETRSHCEQVAGLAEYSLARLSVLSSLFHQLIELARNGFEGRQCELLQLPWQVLGFKFLYLGSPAGKRVTIALK
ncbi:hypothetical protein [Sphingobium sp. BHU LFT2]|nr:hypothetical protein [Sphingobium sp. BHU LFT2]